METVAFVGVASNLSSPFLRTFSTLGLALVKFISRAVSARGFCAIEVTHFIYSQIDDVPVFPATYNNSSVMYVS
jgi:hypothetical protein